VVTASGQAYQIGTRSAQTSLRLKDGETQVLAGLINDQDRSTASKVPGLGQVPVAGRLFSSNNGTSTKSEIVLSITPHIIRPQTLPEARNGDVWSGTEAVVREKPLRLDPIGAARSGNAADMPALAPPGTNPPSSANAPTAQPAAGPKAGGAGGSSILNASRPPIDTVDPTTPSAPAAAAAAGVAPIDTGASSTVGTAPPVGSGTTPRAPARRPPPPSIQPGRAMAPAAPSAPPGSNPPAPPAVTE